MRRGIFDGLFLIVFLTIFSVAGYAAEKESSSGENNNDLFYIDVKGKGLYIDRAEKFHIANTGMMQPTPTIHSLVDFNMNKWASGYEIIFGLTKLNSVGLEASFGQCYTSLKSEDNLIGIGGDHVTLMGFMEGKYGSAISKGFFANADPIGGQFGRGDSLFKYDLRYDSSHLNIASNVINNNNLNLMVDLFVGPSYSRFWQLYRFRTTGQNPEFGTTDSDTQEELTDDLLGCQLGIRGKWQLFKKFFISSSQAFDLFYRRSRFSGKQDISNACSNDDAHFNANLRISEKDQGFVPHFESTFNLGYNIMPNVSISFFYQFDLWNNLTRIENPVVRADLRVSSGSAQIASDDLTSHAIGVSALCKF